MQEKKFTMKNNISERKVEKIQQLLFYNQISWKIGLKYF